MAVTRHARRLSLAAAWAGVAILIAFGAAGLIGGVGGPPDAGRRTELTWAGDAALEPELDRATADVEALADDIAGLSDASRTALAALVATDLDLLESAVVDGDRRLAAVAAEASTIRSRLLGLRYIVPTAADPVPPITELTLSGSTRERFRSLYDALNATTGLPAAWARFSGGSVAAHHLTTLLIDHDASTAEAAARGRAGEYDAALIALDTSDAIIAEGRTRRDELANSVDVTTLTEWLDRNAAYDEALRALYAALRESGGRVNDEVRAAFEAEQATRERLPPDTRGFVVILAEIARGGLNEAAIGIEETRGRLNLAVDRSVALDRLAGPDAAEAGPDPSSPPAAPSP
jgi:hypothetical protein